MHVFILLGKIPDACIAIKLSFFMPGGRHSKKGKKGGGIIELLKIVHTYVATLGPFNKFTGILALNFG